MFKKLFAAALIATSAGASAGVIATNTTPITTSAQAYSQAFNLVGASQTDVRLSITAKGDYGFNYSGFNEYLDFFIDGVQLTHWSSTNLPATASAVNNYTDYDYTLTGFIALTAAQWSQFSADNVLNVSWKNTSDVDAYALGGADYVSFTIEGRDVAAAVPEPTSLALIGLGLAGFGLARRRKS